METSLTTTLSNVQVCNHISDDVVLSILSKLSIKSLRRFECVCKSWSLLLDDNYFMNMYQNNLLSKDCSYYDDKSLLLHMKILEEDDKFYGYRHVLYSLSGERFENKIKLDWPEPLKRSLEYRGCILPLISFNGTLCLKLTYFCKDHEVILLNLSTKEFKVITTTNDDSNPNWFVKADNHQVGYDHVKDDYKMIRCISRRPKAYSYDLHVQSVSFWEIYSLHSDSWKKLDIDLPFDIKCNDQVYMDGVSHWWWLGKSVAHKYINLTSFNFINESFITTPIPSYVDDCFDLYWTERHLMILNGSIAFVVHYKQTATFHISILGELGVKKSWSKLFIVGPLPCLNHLIGAGRNGNILIRKKDDELAWFDLSTGMIDEIGVATKFDCQILLWKESLLPIGGIYSNFSSCFQP